MRFIDSFFRFLGFIVGILVSSVVGSKLYFYGLIKLYVSLVEGRGFERIWGK